MTLRPTAPYLPARTPAFSLRAAGTVQPENTPPTHTHTPLPPTPTAGPRSVWFFICLRIQDFGSRRAHTSGCRRRKLRGRAEPRRPFHMRAPFAAVPAIMYAHGEAGWWARGYLDASRRPAGVAGGLLSVSLRALHGRRGFWLRGLQVR